MKAKFVIIPFVLFIWDKRQDFLSDIIYWLIVKFSERYAHCDSIKMDLSDRRNFQALTFHKPVNFQASHLRDSTFFQKQIKNLLAIFVKPAPGPAVKSPDLPSMKHSALCKKLTKSNLPS